jgi:hypothetical protein
MLNSNDIKKLLANVSNTAEVSKNIVVLHENITNGSRKHDFLKQQANYYGVEFALLEKIYDRHHCEWTSEFGSTPHNFAAEMVKDHIKFLVVENGMISEELEYHIENKIPLCENVYRVGSESYFKLFTEARRLHRMGRLEVDTLTEYLLKETDIGEFALYEGEHVPLDCPMEDVSEELNEEKNVELNSPKRGGSKKYYVYVRSDAGNVIKIEFGDAGGLTAKINDPDARRSFVARHQCDMKKDKTKAGYWACRLPYYAKQLGLSGGGRFFW